MRIFNTSLHICSDWLITKKSKCDVGNYRPISVLPVLSKILERAVHDQLYNYLTCNNILHQCQSGFRSNYSAHTALLDVTDHILENTNDGKVTASIFLDLKKAFDTVSHNLLLQKLDSYGINGKSLRWFKSYLSNRTQAVNINSSLSGFKSIDIVCLKGQYWGHYCLLFLKIHCLSLKIQIVNV